MQELTEPGIEPAALERFSDCVEAIYDCAVDPDLWPVALEKVCGLVNGMNGGIMLVDTWPAGGVLRFQRTWNFPEAEMRIFAAEYTVDNPLTPLFSRFPVDEPYSIAKVLSLDEWERTRIFREFAQPRGWGDSLGVNLLRSTLQSVSMSVVTSAEHGYRGRRDLRVLQLLAPHARRALAIGDLMEMQALKADALESALNRLTPGVALIDERGGPVFANESAKRGGALAHPLLISGRRVGLADREADAAFQRALEQARNGDVQPLTLAVRDDEGAVSFVYALPVGRSGPRGRLAPTVAYALFVTNSPTPLSLPRDAWAGAFGLTLMETNVLDQLVSGLSPDELARELGVAMPTVRTHMASLFRKTGTERQQDLIRLAASLQPPVDTSR